MFLVAYRRHGGEPIYFISKRDESVFTVCDKASRAEKFKTREAAERAANLYRAQFAAEACGLSCPELVVHEAKGAFWCAEWMPIIDRTHCYNSEEFGEPAPDVCECALMHMGGKYWRCRAWGSPSAHRCRQDGHQ